MNNAARSEPQKKPPYADNGGKTLGLPVGETTPQALKKAARKPLFPLLQLEFLQCKNSMLKNQHGG